MPLESTVLCLDNSEWMRNGDYTPSRLVAQHDAASMLCGAKIQSHPESTVGVIAMAGKSVQLLASPTDSIGNLLNAIHSVSINGTVNFLNAIQVAQLSLKHRCNKRGAQRIIVFVGSPVAEDDKVLIKIGKLLKKNNIAVHVVTMGDIPGNAEKLQAFVDASNSNNNSHLVHIPVGMMPSDVLVSSPVIRGEEAVNNVVSGAVGDSFAEYGGVDPSMDPELALALRVSMEEERARQEAAQQKAAEDTANQNAAQPSPPNNTGGENRNERNAPNNLAESTTNTLNNTANSSSAKAAADNTANAAKENATTAPASNSPFMDATFVNSLISGLPGVDRNDPRIQAFIQQHSQQSESNEKEEEKKEM
uniref:26S proteasome nonATPase regulatory subunit putative n=1 Tax=Albugo laibachii Nc14 TaxID=890382 RepID=F0WDY4_9STRA|nr:26S proteasome nonATPase regulatory subunit putative [Albugo laibachii Nc14]|eukprot:CCA19412.1 26S proteasome nonATPase regulatory subunit putative [Albugo laibachii Nc14]